MEDRHGGIRDRIERMDSDIRILQRQVEHCELREKQLIIMFKMILDKSKNSVRQGKHRVTIPDIIEFMEQLVNKNLTPEEKAERNVDLLSQVVKQSH